MGAPKTKTVGGGQATATANNWNQFLNQGLSSGTFGGSASNNGFAGALNQMLGGTGAQAQLPNAPEFQGFNPQQLASNLDLSGFNYTPNLPGMDNPMIQRMMSGGMGGVGAGMAGTSATGVPDFMANQMSLQKVDMNDPQFAALSQQLAQNNALGLANARARFGQGGNSLSSGASLAEAQYNAQVNPASTLAMGQLQRDMRGMNLQEAQALEQAYQGRLGLGSQSQLGNRQISSNESIANAGNATQANIASASNMMQGQGQLLNYLVNSGQLGLAAAGQNAQNAMGAFNSNMQAGQYNNQNMYNAANMQNNFNQNMFGQQSQNAMGQAQLNQQAQLAAMQGMFGAMGQSNQLGTPQAQTVQTPSALSQWLGPVAGAAMGIGGLMTGNPMLAMSGLGMLGGNPGLGAQMYPYGNPNQYSQYQPGNVNIGAMTGYNPQGFNPTAGWNQFNPNTGYGGVGGWGIPMQQAQLNPAFMNQSYGPSIMLNSAPLPGVR